MFPTAASIPVEYPGSQTFFRPIDVQEGKGNFVSQTFTGLAHVKVGRWGRVGEWLQEMSQRAGVQMAEPQRFVPPNY